MEVRGLITAGADDPGLAERQLLDDGIATTAELSGRTSAMEVYLETLAQRDGTRLPPYVDRLVADRLFPEALMALAASVEAYAPPPTLPDDAPAPIESAAAG